MRVEAARSLACQFEHARAPGTLDETARRLSHDEYAVADLLVREGHHVRSVATGQQPGRAADLLVCGSPVEIKSWLSWDERGGRGPTVRSVVNKLRQAEGQAATVVLNGRGSGLSETAARRGLATYTTRANRSGVTWVRVLGDDFDLGWTRSRAVHREHASLAEVRLGRGPGVGL
jgi:hypothetical protein